MVPWAVGMVLRLLYVSGASGRPKIKGEEKVYGIKWQLYLLMTMGLVGAIAFVIKFGHDADWWFIGIMALVLLSCFVCATGSVTTDPDGIKVQWLWIVRSCHWNEVREIRFNQNNHQVDIIGGARKLQIDWRFPTDSILEEAARWTGLQPIVKT